MASRTGSRLHEQTVVVVESAKAIAAIENFIFFIGIIQQIDTMNCFASIDDGSKLLQYRLPPISIT